MAVNLSSPGILVTETDKVASVPSSGATIGATAGAFRWGPIGEPVLVTNETELVGSFGKPATSNITTFLTAANYLSYASAEYVVRAANTTGAGANSALNATSESSTGSASPGTGLLIENDEDYDANFADGSANAGPWVAKYAGELGNSLKVSVCASSSAWSNTVSGTWTVAAGTKSVSGVGTSADTQLKKGDILILGGRRVQVATIDSNTAITLVDAHLTGASSEGSVVRYWEYSDLFDDAPGTSASASQKNASGDEMHIVVVDEDGLFTGTRGAILEKYQSVSKASDAKTESGNKNYYKDVVNETSKFIRWIDHEATTNWGTALGALTYTGPVLPSSFSMAGGSDGLAVTQGETIAAYLKLTNKAKYNISLVMMGEASATVINSVLADLVEKRKDLVLTFSPSKASVVNNSGSEVDDIKTFADSVTASNYAFMDSNWKYQYDKYNDRYVWVPCNADTAGCMARTDVERAPWYSPAGYAQGRILNAVKLAWNPDQADRDALYKRAVNPIFTKEGRGTVLFGDKTFTTGTGSFSRINVRRLFLTIEKAISAVAENVLFEQNDEETRSAFVNTVVPYLRTVQSQRGMTDFAVVCDDTNNPEDVVNANEFVADIYVRPTSTVNFIQLNFVSVRGAAAIAELAG